MRRRRTVLAACALVLPLLGASAPALAVTPKPGPHGSAGTGAPAAERFAALRARAGGPAVRWSGFDDARAWGRGTLSGVRVEHDRLVFSESERQRTYGGKKYDVARWTSPWVESGADFTRLIASWNAVTPGDSWIEVSVRGRTSRRATDWDVLGRWAAGDQGIKRRSLDAQTDGGTSVNVDTWQTPSLRGYQLSVALLRKHGTKVAPSLSLLGAVTSPTTVGGGATSAPGPARGKVLDVPRYSQMVHRGHYPRWGGGGEAWCSPTSISMVLGYDKALPKPRRYRWIPSGHVDPWVDYAARMTYDYTYEGTGNWPFNTAYAGSRVASGGGSAFVTRLGSMRQVERFIVAGIPVVISVAFGPGQLTGAPITSSNGHLLVVVGFRRNGDVVVNDPAASSRSGVRRVYDRGQLERIWLRASAGTAYIVHTGDQPLPKGRSNAW